MPFLSQILGRQVKDAQGALIGKLNEVMVNAEDGAFPRVVAFGINQNGQERVVAANLASDMEPHSISKGIALAANLGQLTDYQPTGSEIELNHSVLDRQIIDTNGRRVVRVNDLRLDRPQEQGDYRLVGADVSARALLRRIGIPGLFSRERDSSSYIPWEQLDPVSIGPEGIKLKVSREQLSRLHPADVASILSQLDEATGSLLISSLTDEDAADALEQFPTTESQVAVIEHLDNERAADILEEMAHDEAADILNELPDERAEELLNLMDRDEAIAVRALLGYEDDTAGGAMTNEFVAVAPAFTAADTMKMIREEAPEAETIYYVYVLDDEKRLLGYLTLRDLIIAPPEQPVSAFMREPLGDVMPDLSREDVAAVLAKYNLLAVPVVDADNKMLGMVTLDDAIEVVLPPQWKRRLPKVFALCLEPRQYE